MTVRESFESPERAKDKRSVWEDVTQKSAAEGAAAADERFEVEHGSRFFNREFSALEYNARLLACAEDVRRPALDRARFLAIFSRNLDEFFQIRVSGLREQADAGVTGASPDGLSPRQQLDEIRARAQELVARQVRVFEHDVKPLLYRRGVRITEWDDLKKAQRHELQQVFEERIFRS